MTYNIQANASGTRKLTVSDEHLQTIKKYGLLDGMTDSTGIIDESKLDKLRLTVRSILESQQETDKELLNLAFEVIYHNDMKVIGLKGLIELYNASVNESENLESETLEP